MDNKLIVGLVLAALVCVGVVLAVVTTGGHGVITESRDIGGTEVDIFKIAFNGNIGYDKNNVPKGGLHIKFHELGTHMLDGASFHGNLIRDIELENVAECPLPRRAPYNVITYKAVGRLNNKYGWTVYITLTDFEEPAELMDGVRIVVEHPTEGTFDTGDGTYFTVDHVFPGCAVEGITRIDSGNVRMH